LRHSGIEEKKKVGGKRVKSRIFFKGGVIKIATKQLKENPGGGRGTPAYGP